MNELTLLTEFHFQRPLWLLAILPSLLIALLLWGKTFKADQWQQLISPTLLPHLLDGATTRAKPITLIALFTAWLIAALALAGPSWEKRPVAVEQHQDALVILLDLSPSMMSQDLKPSRLVRARLKIIDLLRERKDGQNALLVYADDVHTVTPLTDDRETIINLIPALHPDMMPSPGSRTELAVKRALELLKNSGIESGQLLIITDGIADAAHQYIVELMNAHPTHQLSILGVGTAEPTPIPTAKGGFVRDRNRNIVTTQLDASSLNRLASQAGGIYKTLGNDNSDVKALASQRSKAEVSTSVDREFDAWYDRGPWLALLLLPFVLYAFRRGVLLCGLCIVPLLMAPDSAVAFSKDDLLLNSHQQAQKLFEQEQFDAASEKAISPEWKAAAHYRAGHYDKAAAEYAKVDSPSAHYNRGNALAKSGNLDEALRAYEKALEQDPTLGDAKKNYDIVKQLKEASKQESEQQDQQSDDSNQEESGDKSDDTQQSDTSSRNQDQQENESDSSSNSAQDSDQQSSEQDASDSATDEESSEKQQQQQQQQQQNDMNQRGKQDAEQQSEDATQQEQTSSAAAQQAEQATEQDENEARDENAVTQPAYHDNLSDEERQAMEQWLRRVPDDPSGLLRNKFQYEHAKKRHQMLNGNWPTTDLSDEERW